MEEQYKEYKGNMIYKNFRSTFTDTFWKYGTCVNGQWLYANTLTGIKNLITEGLKK